MPLIVLPPSRLLSISDGDTPEVKMGVRLLGIDAPELHFPLGSPPKSQDPIFAKRFRLKGMSTADDGILCQRQLGATNEEIPIVKESKRR